MAEHVVLLDEDGRARGTLPKPEAHHADTPLHLAFSCHVVDGAGRALLARRAVTKRTWPGVWSNACCGHPQLGETLREAVERRVHEELGVRVVRLGLALPTFTYRATMVDGTVEHELCPVFVAEVEGEPAPDPAEVAAVAWIRWDDLQARVRTSPHTLSPWSVQQLPHLDGRVPDDAPRADARVTLGELVVTAAG